MTMADNIVVMSNGQVEQFGPPQDIYHKPVNAFVADFIGRANFFEGTMQGGKITVGNLSLDAGSKRFIDGSPVVVAIRPEKISLDADMPQANRAQGEVVFVRDVGATRDIHLNTPLGPMIVEYAIGEGARRFTVGEKTDGAGVIDYLTEKTDVQLPESALYVYPAEQKQKSA